jgi:hypothetical protein
MKKFQFNPQGIQALQYLLHALPDARLVKEVIAIRLNFRLWLKRKFDLTIDELNFLDLLSDSFLSYAGTAASNFLAQRKTVRLTFKKDEK